MPRPTHQPGSPAAKKNESSFSISSLLRNRKERRRRKEEDAAKAITNDRAENENKIVTILSSINFVNTPIPKEKLEHKSNPDQQWGDLEYGARAAQKMLRDAPYFEVDTAPIDAKLLQLANEFKSAVTAGNVRQAYAAKAALVTCIQDIRHRIPTVNPDLVDSFIKSGVKYMDTWLAIVENSSVADGLERNVKTQRTQCDAKEEDLKKRAEEVFKKLNEDKKYLSAYASIKDKIAPQNPAMWTPDQVAVRKMLVQLRFDKFSHGLMVISLDRQEMKLRGQEGKIDALGAEVAKQPIPEDENALNKFNEQMDNFIKDLAEMDTEMDSLLTAVEDIEGRLKILDEAPGAVHLRETIADEAEAFLNEYSKMQEEERSNDEVNRDAFFAKYRLKSKEEQEQLVAQAEAIRNANKQEAHNMNTQTAPALNVNDDE